MYIWMKQINVIMGSIKSITGKKWKISGSILDKFFSIIILGLVGKITIIKCEITS